MGRSFDKFRELFLRTARFTFWANVESFQPWQICMRFSISFLMENPLNLKDGKWRHGKWII